MSHHWKKCPYCGRTVEEGYGLPLKSLGDPKKRCRFCQNTYIDRDIIDWKSASLFSKFLFCLANGRFFICLIPYIIVSAHVYNMNVDWEDWQVYLACSPVILIIFALCLLYVKLKVKAHYDGFFPNKIDDEEPKNNKDISVEKQYESQKEVYMPFSNNKKNYIGTCTMCGKKNTMLTIVDEVEHVCEECLDGEYIECEECKEFWLYDIIKFYHLKDGRTLCEHCAEDIEEDEVDFIENHTGID